MSTSFRRGPRIRGNGASSISGLRGTRPWAGGITLTSVGLRDLDAILGGGHPLGTCLLLEEDRWTRDLALCLIKYWCAQAVSHEQSLVVPYFHDEMNDALSESPPDLNTDYAAFLMNVSSPRASRKDLDGLIDSLPRNLHWDKTAGKTVDDNETSRPLEILEEEANDDDAEEGLTIAWQYRKDIQNERLGHGTKIDNSTTVQASSNEFCHSFDLNGRLCEQEVNFDCIQIVDGTCCNRDGPCQKSSCGFHIFQKLRQHVQDQLCASKGRVIRVLLYKAPLEAASIAVPLLLSFIRSEDLPVVLMISVHSWTSSNDSALINLRRACDVVMTAESFVSRAAYPPPAEFRHLHGLLLLPKVSTVTAASANGGGHFSDMTASKRPPAHVYGLKRDRRKLHIPLLHIPPEDYAGGGSVGVGAVRSGAGRTKKKTMGCNTSGGSSVLDF